eukprot:CAMPEP_0177628376 /NCGR_PEP_ID=MMETSP0447-20121125/99_1 /TAXON_ID=0 /ORGANISM="Stygamoeba regulata, Strain BSH-02190019" /LENGTH=366 /DNA_ID=CAMNT_0019129621 /DNA_START=62 /DNA_END=1162 /DNA_ORIENTATION=+
MALLNALETYGVRTADWQRYGASFRPDCPPFRAESADREFDCLLLSTVAYYDEEVLPAELMRLSQQVGPNELPLWPALQAIVTTRHLVSTTAAQCMIVEPTDGVLVLAFRGTELPSMTLQQFWQGATQFREDWMSNMMCRLVPAGGFARVAGNVHQGWLEAAACLWVRGVRADILEFLERHPKGRLLVTGHSQGAGLATITAAKLMASQRYRVAFASLCTIATPKVGDAAFVNSVNNVLQALQNQDQDVGIFRTSNRSDPVPLLPPFEGYVHGPGTHVHYDQLPLPLRQVYGNHEDEQFFEQAGSPEFAYPGELSLWTTSRWLWIGARLNTFWWGLYWWRPRRNWLNHFPFGSSVSPVGYINGLPP